MKDGAKIFEEKVLRACEKAKRDVRALKLLAVSKGQNVSKIEHFIANGIPFWALGESYLEEVLEKQKKLKAAVSWHFIGRLQSRKIPEILAACEVLHSVSRSKELEWIAKTPRDFFIQVNVSSEDTKNGARPSELGALFESIDSRKLKVRCLGLMALPSSLEDVSESQVRREMALLRGLRDKHLPKGLLNMGTSSDFEIAIEEGADVLRVGSLLFGERTPR
ncbi:MAG: YggS family pyridoxal phosphate-dependent enzyme [Bdellovibrionota bacterium]